MSSTEPVLEQGQIYLTAAVDALLGDDHSPIAPLLHRHARGDWGEVSADSAAENTQALTSGERVMSIYTTDIGGRSVTLWIITEAGRAFTTVLLPDDY